jgi:hypothetical protein
VDCASQKTIRHFHRQRKQLAAILNDNEILCTVLGVVLRRLDKTTKRVAELEAREAIHDKIVEQNAYLTHKSEPRPCEHCGCTGVTRFCVGCNQPRD